MSQAFVYLACLRSHSDNYLERVALVAPIPEWKSLNDLIAQLAIKANYVSKLSSHVFFSPVNNEYQTKQKLPS